MLIKDKKYSYNDVMVVPAKISSIEHRAECDVFHKDGYLPIFTAPMSSVVNCLNYELFEQNHIHAIMPRNIEYDIRLEYALNNKWAAFSLSEFENFFCDEGYVKEYIKKKKKVLIDIANGHMKKLFVVVKKAKRLYGESLQIMIGNIANPFTYEEVFKCGADYVRIGIGAGNGCFVEGTKVLTKNGEKNIEDVNIGDVVITHKLQKKEVINTISYKTEKNKILNINNNIKCTKNHKFYVVNKSDKEKITDDNIHEFAYWVEAKDLDKSKHFLLKKV